VLVGAIYKQGTCTMTSNFTMEKSFKKMNVQKQWEEKKNLMVVEIPHMEMKFHVIKLHHSH